MIRISAVAFLVLFSFLTQANAVTNGDLFKDCKGYADKNFKPDHFNDVACVYYVAAIRDFSHNVCRFNLEPSMWAADPNSKMMDAYIQQYVNDVVKQPETWGDPADYYVLLAIQKISPCKQ